MHARTLAAAALLMLPMSAFAGRSEADVAITAARSNIAAAERAGAAQRAPIEYESAVAMLNRAQFEYNDRDWTDAERAADRAKADARLAEARARQHRAEAVLAELETTIETLRREIERGGV